MNNRESHDRNNWEHRKDPDFQVGESMPGTVGDSEGTLHDRLGDQPVNDESAKIFEPGQKARERQEETESETNEEEVSVKKLVERL